MVKDHRPVILWWISHRPGTHATGGDIRPSSTIARRECEPWDRDRLVLDTAQRSIAECVAQLRSAISNGHR